MYRHNGSGIFVAKLCGGFPSLKKMFLHQLLLAPWLQLWKTLVYLLKGTVSGDFRLLVFS
jgi:hypothetical protein